MAIITDVCLKCGKSYTLFGGHACKPDEIKCPKCERTTEQDSNSFTCHRCQQTWPKGYGHEKRI
jgi:hypothetical protein